MKKWFLATKKANFQEISNKYHIDPVLARIMRNRDIISDEEIKEFLFGGRDELYLPEELKDMEKAVSLICKKIQKGSKIRIIGDYDVDGICATYILYRALQCCGARVDTVIPHRMKDGYGINNEMIQNAICDGIDLIITCDNGIAAKEAFELARENGISCIITDHHEIPFLEENGEKKYILPSADAIINPKQIDCHYPFPDICGAYVAFQLSKAFLQKFNTEVNLDDILEELMVFAGMATVCDIMPLRGENRILVKEMLRLMQNPKNLGLRALLKVNEIIPEKVNSYTIGFVLGPCINATGRLDTAEIALDLFKTNCEADAINLATQLKELNLNRKELTQLGVDNALNEVNKETYEKDRVLVIYLPNTHESIAGIIAGRVKEKTGKPTFIITDGEEDAKGSARSIEAYHIYEEMVKCKDLFIKFGGHKMAAGFSIKKENIENFRREINKNCTLKEEDFDEKIVIDVPMPLSYVTKELIDELHLLEPFGNGNQKPVFAQKDIRVLQIKPMGRRGDMAKLKVKDTQENTYELIMFSGGDALIQESPKKIDILYYPSINEYRGVEEIQFVIQDYRKCE